MRTRIKFCGMTRAEDVAAAVALGVDAIGLILVPGSPRALSLSQAVALRASLPPFVASVALSLDADPADAQRSAATLRPTFWQFHGSEAPEDCDRIGLPYLKAVPMAQPEDAAAFAARYRSASGFVLDSHVAGGQGGSGRRFDWSRIPADLGRPLVLAGGLTPDNVFDAVCAVRPYAVDVSSGIESAPGVKDGDRMRAFVAQVQRADAILRSA
nr:phosphoribosylanthranilate isomerase [Chiayiivirga flava]